MRKQRVKFDKARQRIFSAAPVENVLQVERLETIIANIELSIPPGTIARQFNLRSNNLRGEGLDNLRKVIHRSQQRVPSSNSLAESATSSKGPGSFNYKLASVSESVVSSLMKIDNSMIDPHALLSAAPSQRFISR